jgi:multidrug efflux pump subunit AcrB
MIPISDLVKVKTDTLQKTIYRKDQKRVVYVTDMAGAMESPVYAILGMTEKLDKIDIPKATNSMNCIWTNQPMKVIIP